MVMHVVAQLFHVVQRLRHLHIFVAVHPVPRIGLRPYCMGLKHAGVVCASVAATHHLPLLSRAASAVFACPSCRCI